MGGNEKKYVLDTNVFIEAHRRYYGFDLCPGFWDCLQYYSNTRVFSIDRVFDEISGGDQLDEWTNDAASNLFLPTDTTGVTRSYSQIMDWVHANSQFSQAALDQFARVADGWVVAYAKANACSVVTHEIYNPDKQSVVKIPNVCRAFDIHYTDTFKMLKDLQVSFFWERPAKS